MKIAIVDIGWKEIIGPNPMSCALGGSETWLMQISKEFVNNGIDVDLYCNTKENFKFNGVNFICDKEFLETKEKYDFVILNRFFVKNDINYIDLVKYKKIAKHVYIQIHDLSFVINNQILQNVDDDLFFGVNSDFVTVVTLNKWHEKNLIAQYPQLDGRTINIPNGVDLSLFKEHNFERDNRILWSSCAERGLDILINDIYPLVKKEIPDFGVDVAGYNDLSSIETEGKDIKVLGRLTKEQLYEEMSKHKVWFYPGTFAETFCITMLEQFLSGAQIVSPFTYGMRPTIGYADNIKMENIFAEPVYKQAVQEAADKIIEILKGKQAPDVYSEIEKKIHNEYNWTNSVNLYTSHYKSLFCEGKEKNILILTMSCNIPYFKTLLSVVKDTWVKPIISGKYDNIQWFSYTSCDKKHPTPYIDWDDRMIYIDCPDDLNHTYEKTKKAYEMVKNSGIDFDYVVRTNTSGFVNIKKLIEYTKYLKDSDIIGLQYNYYVTNGKEILHTMNLVAGFFIGMSRELFDIAMSLNNDSYLISAPDDVIWSYALSEKFGNFTCKSPNPNYNRPMVPHYKGNKQEDENTEYVINSKTNAKYNHTFIKNPMIVNSNVVIKVRPFYEDLLVRSEKGHEFEHFYELNDALG